MKAIRIQIDMLYEAPDDQAAEIYERDVMFFDQVIKKEFESWAEKDDDPRNPISFDLSHIIGEVKEDQ